MYAFWAKYLRKMLGVGDEEEKIEA